MTTTTLQQRELKAQFVWTSFILTFFLVQAMVWVAAISITSGDSSHAVVASYDENALKWDELKSLQQASDRLGWNANIELEDAANVLGEHQVTVFLQDRQGNAIEDANVVLQAFHCARASEVQSVQLVEKDHGQYQGVLRVMHAGMWQLSGTASVMGQVFLIEQRMQIDPQGAH
jgi:nitrogen fixation protein FixH